MGITDRVPSPRDQLRAVSDERRDKGSDAHVGTGARVVVSLRGVNALALARLRAVAILTASPSPSARPLPDQVTWELQCGDGEYRAAVRKH